MTKGKQRHAKAQIDKNLKHRMDPHDIHMKHYFDVAAGIRGSDEGHKAAVEYYKKIKPMLETPQGTLKVAKEAINIAQRARERIADLLECEPRNIFFGNSATRTLVPVFLSLAGEGTYRFVANASGYNAVGWIINESADTDPDMITRQNFGEIRQPSLLRGFDDVILMPVFRKRFNLNLKTIRHMMGIMAESVKDDDFWTKSSVVYEMHSARSTGEVNWYLPLFYRDIQKTPRNIIITDVSHSVGAKRFYARELGDVVIMNSSKSLGAEPTLGICYASDRMISLMEKHLEATGWPSIAFQFSQETRLGSINPNKIAEMDFWMSLPELFSLATMMKNVDVERRQAHFKEIFFYLKAAIRLYENCIRIRTGRSYINIEPEGKINTGNMLSFDIKSQHNDSEALGLWRDIEERIRPYLLGSEKYHEHTFFSSPELDVDSNSILSSFKPIKYLLSKDDRRVRISWSHEHSMDDAQALSKKIAESFDAIFGSECQANLKRLEAILFAPTKQDALKLISAESERAVLLAISGSSEDAQIRTAAFNRL